MIPVPTPDGETMTANDKQVAVFTRVQRPMMALLAAMTLSTTVQAQSDAPADCSSALTATRFVTQSTLAAVATGLEYREMVKGSSWRMAEESDRMAILADPSSHLHALGSYKMARALTSTCQTPAAARRAAWAGAAASLVIGAAKEVSDGMYNGFSPTDLAVDAIGAGYAVAQVYAPALRHVTPILSVSPRTLQSAGGATGALTDYANQTMWLSANVHELLPKSAAAVWPKALRVAAGRRAFGGKTSSEYVVGLDFDAAQLPGTHPAWMRVKQMLHAVRLPGPAVVMGSNGVRTVGLYW
jgi:hypothetical protein